MATPLRRTLGALGALVLALLVVAGTARTADAADGYKYWNYFHVEGGKYAFAQTGPADFTPKDGTVEAYRYGLSTAADGLPPRTDATTYTVEDICAGTEPKSGEKLVGVLLDYGTADDADGGQTPPEPRAACAAVPTAANGQQVLDAVSDLRLDKGLTCGIDGYPASGCSVTVKNPPAAAAAATVDFALPQAAGDTASPDAAGTGTADQAASETDDGGVPWTLIVVVLVVVVIGAASFVLSRRGKNL